MAQKLFTVYCLMIMLYNEVVLTTRKSTIAMTIYGFIPTATSIIMMPSGGTSSPMNLFKGVSDAQR